MKRLSSINLKALSYVWDSVISRTLFQVIWISGVILLPFTSLPFLVQISGASTVAPPSSFLFAALFLLWWVPYVFQRGKVPVEGIPLLLFSLAAITSAAAAFFIFVPPYREANILRESAEALVTLFIGGSVFFISATWLSQDEKNLKLTLRFINWGGALILAWSFVQAIYAFDGRSDYPRWLMEIQKTFVARSVPLFHSRVTGFTYEPSWLAHQLNLLYLPFWLSATLSGYSAHSRKLWRCSLENILLVAGIIILFLSFSRVGWLSFLLMGFFLALVFNLRLIKAVHKRVLYRLRLKPLIYAVSKTALSVLLMSISVAVYAGIGLGLVYTGAKIEPRLSRIIQENLLATRSFYEFTNKLQFAERATYWATGLEIFNDHPLLGVGPGNAGFYFPQKMPAFGWALTEVSDTFYRFTSVPNTKSLWVRILAGTGLVGFSIFLAWYYLLWQSGRLSQSSKDPLIATLGLTGKLMLVGFLIEGFSVDSFALPYLWFTAGLLAGSASLCRRLAVPSNDSSVLRDTNERQKRRR